MSGRAARLSKQKKRLRRRVYRVVSREEAETLVKQIIERSRDIILQLRRDKAGEFPSVLGPTPRVLRGRNVEGQGEVG